MSRPLMLTISDHPIVAERIVLALRAQLGECGRTGLARMALRAADALFHGDTMAAQGYVHHYEHEANKASHLPLPRSTRPPGTPCIAYDPDTSLIWGFGQTLGLCMAAAGWAVTQAEHAELMGKLCFKRAHQTMGPLLDEYGPDLPWTVDLTGQAVPGDAPMPPCSPLASRAIEVIEAQAQMHEQARRNEALAIRTLEARA